MTTKKILRRKGVFSFILLASLSKMSSSLSVPADCCLFDELVEVVVVVVVVAVVLVLVPAYLDLLVVL